MDISKILVEASKAASGRNLLEAFVPSSTGVDSNKSQRRNSSVTKIQVKEKKDGSNYGLKLLESILRNNVQEVQLLLEKGADPNHILTLVKTPRYRPPAPTTTKTANDKKVSSNNSNHSSYHTHGTRKKKARSVSPFRSKTVMRQSQRMHDQYTNDGSEYDNKQQDLEDRYSYMDQVFLWKRCLGESPTLIHVAVLNVYHRHVNGTGIGGFIMRRHEVDKALKILNLMMIFGGRATQTSSNVFLNKFYMRYSSSEIMKTDNPTLRAIQRNNLRRASARRKSRNKSINQQQKQQQDNAELDGKSSQQQSEQQQQQQQQKSSKSDSVDDVRKIQTHAMDLALGIQRMTLWMDLDPAAEAAMVQAVEIMKQHLCDPTKPIVRSHKVPFDLITWEVLEGLRNIIFNWEPPPSLSSMGTEVKLQNGHDKNNNNNYTTNNTNRVTQRKSNYQHGTNGNNNNNNNNNKDDLHRFISFMSINDYDHDEQQQQYLYATNDDVDDIQKSNKNSSLAATYATATIANLDPAIGDII